MVRSLTRALEDPDKWIIAHYLLWWDDPRFGNRRVGLPLVREGDLYVHDMGGLRVELPVPGPDTPRQSYPSTPDRFDWVYSQGGPQRARVDPAQRVAIRNLWNDRLGVTIGTTAYPVPILLSLLLPTWWAIRWYRRTIHGHGVGLCPSCGYDLRATPDRCPECGAVPTR
jgi:hypothetical protein